MSVGEICTRNTVVASEDTSVAAVARLMREHHVGSVVIVKASGTRRKPVGIITDRDLVVAVMATDIDAERVAVGDAMSFDLVTVKDQDDVWDAIQIMRAKGVRRIPVVDGGGDLAGILSVDDVLDFLAGVLSDLVRLINREQSRETRKRAAL